MAVQSARTGVRGDYYFLAQWFPKIGVLEPDGTWNCHQFIQTEFYADFGNYDVKLTVPTGWVVNATGKEMERTRSFRRPDDSPLLPRGRSRFCLGYDASF
ncbi:hypothetical protein MJD09_06690 [bacterium]|nr:hypothetical protein [bacterium]